MQQTLGYHKLSFDSYHWMNMENKLEQAGSVCMANTITVNQYIYIHKNETCAEHHRWFLFRWDKEKPSAFFLSQLVTKANITTTTYGHSICISIYVD